MTPLALLMLLSAPLHAETVEEIIDQSRENRTLENSVQRINMVLVGRNGAERVREFEMKVRKDDDDVVRSYARFSHPTDVAGTQLVMVDHPDRTDEQLLFLPALKRVTRIAGKARSGSFMGSDFSYEDLEFSGLDDATHTMVSEDDSQWVIDTVPGEDSSYTRIRTYVQKADYLPKKVEFFDKRDQPLKTLTVEESTIENGSAFPTKSTMENLQKGTKTRLEVIEHRLNVPAEELPEEMFTATWMENHG